MDIPLRVHVIFEPTCQEAREQAFRLYRWLRMRELGDDGGGSSIDVVYHTSPHALETLLSARQTSQFTAHVVLCDDLMLLDVAWRTSLEALASAPTSPGRFTYPVMLSANMSKLQSFSAAFDPLRVWNRDDGAAPEGPLQERWLDRRFARLRRAFADQILRDIPPPACHGDNATERSTDTTPRLQTFLSHAKIDGDDIAQHIRDTLARYSRLTSWYDQNDLEAGKNADLRMENAARQSSGGLIAISTPQYATRPWCWREAVAARTPRHVVLKQNNAPVYLNQAAVVVHRSGERWARTVPALARLPHIGWPDDHAERDARTAALIDRLYLELLLQRLFQWQVALCDGVDSVDPTRIFLGFTPDPWTLSHVIADLTGYRSGNVDLVYTGHGLRPEERRDLEPVVTGCGSPSWRLCTLEESLQTSRPTPRRADQVWIALSGGGHSPELYTSGVSEEHLEDFMLRLTRQLVERGYRVAYGGSIAPDERPKQKNFVLTLLDVARGWWDNEQANKGSSLEDGRIVRNYVAVGNHGDFKSEFRAGHLDICEFILIDAPPTGMATHPPRLTWDLQLTDLSPAARLRRTCNALTHMRRVSTHESAARILFGGRIFGWKGWLPGIAEELLSSIDDGQPFLLLGGLGGIASVIADFFATPTAPWPLELRPDAHLRPHSTEWGEDERQTQQTHFDDLRRSYHQLRNALHQQGSIFGLPREEWFMLLTLQDHTEILATVDRLLPRLQRQRPNSPSPASAATVLTDRRSNP